MALNIDSITNAARREGAINLFEYSSLFKTFYTKTILDAKPGTSYTVNYLEDGGTLLDWCVAASGDVNAKEALVEAVGVQLAKSLCEPQMSALLIDAAAKQGDYASVEEAIIANQKYAFAKLVDALLIGGDKAQGANNKLNGLVKLVKTGGTKIERQSNESVKDFVQRLILNIPDKAYDMNGDIVILMNKASLASLKLQLMGTNSNFMPSTENADEFYFPGFSNIKVMAADAMGDNIIATPANNVVILNNVVEEPTIVWTYDVASDSYISRIKSVAGIALFDATLTLYMGE